MPHSLFCLAVAPIATFFWFLTPQLNRFYLRCCCHYLRTDECGNKIYQAPYFDPDSDVLKLISVEPEAQNYLISYHYWYAYDCFYDEYLQATDSIFDD